MIENISVEEDAHSFEDPPPPNHSITAPIAQVF